MIDCAIGEASMFHETYGVYAQGVDRSTALLAPEWNQRLVPLVDPATGTTGWCLDVHDLFTPDEPVPMTPTRLASKETGSCGQRPVWYIGPAKSSMPG